MVRYPRGPRRRGLFGVWTNTNVSPIYVRIILTNHNERFIVRLVEKMRQGLIAGTFAELKEEFLGQYALKGQSSH